MVTSMCGRFGIAGGLFLASLVGQGRELEPGQVWRSLSADRSESVELVVLELMELEDIGAVVVVRMAGIDGPWPDSIENQNRLEAIRVRVFSEAVLRSHLHEVVTTLPRQLFGAWERQRWLASYAKGAAEVDTVSPATWSRSLRGAGLDGPLLAYLPAEVSRPAVEGNLTSIEIRVVDGVKRFQVEERSCADLESLLVALRDLGPPTGVTIKTFPGVTYGDVAQVLGVASDLGIERTEFPSAAEAEKPKSERLPIRAGETWRCRVPEGQPMMLLSVLHVAVGDFGELIFGRVEGAADSFAVFHGQRLRRFLSSVEGSFPVPEDSAAAAQVWLGSFGRGEVGYTARSPWSMTTVPLSLTGAAPEPEPDIRPIFNIDTDGKIRRVDPSERDQGRK